MCAKKIHFSINIGVAGIFKIAKFPELFNASSFSQYEADWSSVVNFGSVGQLICFGFRFV